MSNPIVALGDFISGRALDAVSVLTALGGARAAEASAKADLKAKEIAYMEARERTAQAEAAKTKAASLINSKTEQLVTWTLITIAGGVLTTVVLKMAGFK
jgi:hypothetical protein